jgi:hypothetical protein
MLTTGKFDGETAEKLEDVESYSAQQFCFQHRFDVPRQPVHNF